MIVHPQIAAALKALDELGLPPLEAMTPAAARAQMLAMVRERGGEALPVRRVEDRRVPGPAGDIPVRLYWPHADGPLPVVLYFHGGGHVIGDLDTHDLVVRNLCAGSGALFVSVDYRMGPEHRFPAAVEDSWAALLWAAASAAELGADPARLAVCGDSAGGNLAAVMALLARDAGAPPLRLQALIYPVADYGLTGESYGLYSTGYGRVTRAAMEWFRSHYLGDVREAEDWRASPIRAASLAGVAPAVVVTAGCDVLRDDGCRYAAALEAAAVAVDHREYPGMIHGFFALAPAVDDAVDAQGHVSAALQRALA